MHATGRLFLSRTRPTARTAADGTFGLQLYAVDRIATHQTESWVVCWYGPEASAFWQQHQAQLVPGAAIHVDTHHFRAHQMRGCVPEIHARAARVRLEANPSGNHTPQPTRHPAPAHHAAMNH